MWLRVLTQVQLTSGPELSSNPPMDVGQFTIQVVFLFFVCLFVLFFLLFFFWGGGGGGHSHWRQLGLNPG